MPVELPVLGGVGPLSGPHPMNALLGKGVLSVGRAADDGR